MGAYKKTLDETKVQKMVVYFIPVGIIVAVTLLAFGGGAWLFGNFLIGLLPILNFLFIPLVLVAASLSYIASTVHGRDGHLSHFRACIAGVTGFVVAVQAWLWSVLGVDGYDVNSFTRTLLGPNGETVSFSIDNTYRTLDVVGCALIKVVLAAGVFVAVAALLDLFLGAIGKMSNELAMISEIFAIALIVFLGIQFVHGTTADYMNQQVAWAQEHSRTVGEYRLMLNCRPNQSMLMNFNKNETPGTQMIPWYCEVKAGTTLTVTNKREYDIWMNKNDEYVECYTSDGVYGFVKADLLEGYDAG